MTSKERTAAIKALPQERKAFMWKVNLAYVFLALAFILFIVVTAIVNSAQAMNIGCLLYALALMAQAIYWPEASWMYGRSTAKEWFYAGLFLFFGVLGLMT